MTVPVQDKGLVTQGSGKKEMEGREEKREGQIECKGHPGHESFSYSDNSWAQTTLSKKILCGLPHLERSEKELTEGCQPPKLKVIGPYLTLFSLPHHTTPQFFSLLGVGLTASHLRWASSVQTGKLAAYIAKLPLSQLGSSGISTDYYIPESPCHDQRRILIGPSWPTLWTSHCF